MVLLMMFVRLFLQSCSDDATHDEALSSRIAAVNLLDLNLTHLGVDVGESGAAVESVVKACGEGALNPRLSIDVRSRNSCSHGTIGCWMSVA